MRISYETSTFAVFSTFVIRFSSEASWYTQMYMTHYICTGGCEGVSETPGTCQAVTCPKHGAPLEACDCADGKHFGKLDRDAGEDEDK